MNKETAIQELRESFKFLSNSSSCLSEEDSEFAPKEGLMTVAQQFAHIAQTVDWFINPIETGDSFNMDFEGLYEKAMQVCSLEKAKDWLSKSIDSAVAILEDKDDAYLSGLLPEGPIMGGEPRLSVIGGILDHTSHHRGVLTVYARLLGKTPSMPYGDF
ncbi:MAG: hypothetical protein COA79_19240 [Planctomycetota bacterium]|nr:MAG: hypothetical protein COA79_19240 [Planctomycetota bacterium]